MENTYFDKDVTNRTVVLAGFMRRLVAFCIDIIILIVSNTFIGMMVLFSMQFFCSVDSDRFDIIAITGMSILVVLYIVYFSIGESSICQCTIGKKITKIKVVNLDGSKLCFSKAAARTVVKYISIFTFLGSMLMFFTSKRQALHDYVLGTLVVRV